LFNSCGHQSIRELNSHSSPISSIK
jgi:hypothetical protein